ncbi:Fpg/Nei family DNA glycosylase [Shouchella shacheensis]|uniref:Fpg/Nei family DNA glycosylase n=1 Tax=Shouchella shacheensis TaxID=1649580 RepID=UPI000740153C|nr:DNA-formamidopyrimidine glycosylase family protein [Shouchella shacheensis]
MPELPEMETYRRLLSERILHQPISSIIVNREKSLNVSTRVFTAYVQGQTITRLARRGKHLLFYLSNGRVLLLHLMLGGWMYLGTEEDAPDRTKQIILSFEDQNLYFIGLRLGYLHLHDEESLQEALHLLGPEVFLPPLSFASFDQLIGNSRARIKSFFTDQKRMAGVGNLYADEICFSAQLLPTRALNNLGESERQALHASISSVFQAAIEKGGYMEDRLYKEDALTGGYRNHCRVYDRGGERCQRCGSTIIQEELSKRKVFYCPGCQF